MSHLPTTVITTQLPFSQAAFVKQLWTQISSRTSNRLKLYKPSNQCLHWMDSPKWFKHGIEFYFHDWKHACAFLCHAAFCQINLTQVHWRWHRGRSGALGRSAIHDFPHGTFDALESVPWDSTTCFPWIFRPLALSWKRGQVQLFHDLLAPWLQNGHFFMESVGETHFDAERLRSESLGWS